MKETDRAPFREQVLRFASMDFFPSLDEGVKELVDTLIRVSGKELGQARKIADIVLLHGRPGNLKPEEQRKCPTPLDLNEIASTLGTYEPKPKGCEACEGTGWTYQSKTVTDPVSKDPIEVDCQKRCDCALGQFLKTKEAERRHVERVNAAGTEPGPATTALAQARSRMKQHGPNKKKAS